MSQLCHCGQGLQNSHAPRIRAHYPDAGTLPANQLPFLPTGAGEAKGEKVSLVTTGIYGYIRHPMYLASLLIMFSFVLLTLSGLSFLFWIISFLLHNIIAAYEEQDLEKLVVKEYTEYKKKVARWIPKIY